MTARPIDPLEVERSLAPREWDVHVWGLNSSGEHGPGAVGSMSYGNVDGADMRRLVRRILEVVEELYPDRIYDQRPKADSETVYGGWTLEYDAICVVCPTCAFTFDSEHHDVDVDGYTCPACAEASLTAQLREVNATLDRWMDDASEEQSGDDVDAGEGNAPVGVPDDGPTSSPSDGGIDADSREAPGGSDEPLPSSVSPSSEAAVVDRVAESLWTQFSTLSKRWTDVVATAPMTHRVWLSRAESVIKATGLLPAEPNETPFIDVVFDRSPGHDAPRFVETENDRGESINAGSWLKRPDGYWVLRIAPPLTVTQWGELKTARARIVELEEQAIEQARRSVRDRTVNQHKER